MITAIATTRAPLAVLHARFETVLPAVQAEGNTAFRTLRSAEDREDAVAEATLTAWKKFLRAITESASIEPAVLAHRAVESVARRMQRRARLAI